MPVFCVPAANVRRNTVRFPLRANNKFHACLVVSVSRFYLFNVRRRGSPRTNRCARRGAWTRNEAPAAEEPNRYYYDDDNNNTPEPVGRDARVRECIPGLVVGRDDGGGGVSARETVPAAAAAIIDLYADVCTKRRGDGNSN